MSKVCVAWPTDYNPVGNYLGFSRHTTELRKASVKAGLVLDENSEVAVAVGSPRWWVHNEGKKHVLSCAWECHELPPVTKKGAELADAFIVTSPFLEDLFRKEFPNKPVRCVPLGVHPEVFPYLKRRDPLRTKKQMFVFGWVGAANKRKGYELVLIAWEKFLYIWNSVPIPKTLQPILYLKVNPVDKGTVERGPKGLILDSRRLTRDSLCALYHSMDALAYPSYGEGFGLVAVEGAATGLPIIYTPKTALGDIFGQRTGFPLQWAWTTQIQDEGKVQMPQANTQHLAETMLHVMVNYEEARERGKRAAKMIRKNYTWKIAGEKFVAALESIIPLL